MKGFSVYQRQRIVLNSLYLKSSLEDLLYDSPGFSIEEESGSVIPYTRTKISFSPLHSPSTWSWFAPEVDSVDLLCLAPNEKYLFSRLKEYGYNSFLINYFSELELKSSEFKDPEYEEILIKREAHIFGKEEEAVVHYKFHLDGGILLFQRIVP
jgi:hypothetical protein